MYLSRDFYLEEIRNYISKPLIKVITGQRRVGKTVFLEQLKKTFDTKKVLYINKEDKAFDFLKNDDTLNTFLEKEIKDGKTIVICDEIQMITAREKTINSIFSKYKNSVDIYISGSNSALLSSELATLLSGRYVQFQIFPFSYSEFLSYSKEKSGLDSFQNYLNIGGLPVLYDLEPEKLKYDFVNSLIDTIFVKDLIPRFKIKDITLLKELFLFLVNNIGNITNLAGILTYLMSKGISTNLNTLGSYVEILKSAYLVYEVNLYDLQGKKVFDRERKFYIGDHIFRKVLFSGYDTGISKILENIVFLEALRHGYGVFVGKWGDKEIDFVLEKNGKKKYVQVCYLLSDEKVIGREFGNLNIIKDNRPKYVASVDTIDFGSVDGVEHVKLRNLENIFT